MSRPTRPHRAYCQLSLKIEPPLDHIIDQALSCERILDHAVKNAKELVIFDPAVKKTLLASGYNRAIRVASLAEQ